MTDGPGALPPERERWIPGDFTREYGDGTLELRGICSKEYEGGPGVAHGGWTAALMDELLGTCVNGKSPVAVTGTLTVVYVRPLPLEQPLVCRAWIQDRDGRKILARGEARLASSDALLAQAEGTFITVPTDHYERHQRWLREQQP
jgi:acyl-coenzyme A thioesterase PaaI-like protein